MADELGTFAGDALRIIHSIMKDECLDDDGKPLTPQKTRLDAATYLVDQFMGKAKVSVDVHEDNSLVDLLGAVLINPDGQASHQIIVDGEVVDDGDSGMADRSKADQA